MIARSLSIINYRNYARADISFGAGLNVLFGENGQGKTNLLEAVYLLCAGRSHRTSKERELIKSGCEAARVRLKVDKKEGEREIDMLLSPPAKRRVKLDGAPIARSGEMMGVATGVIFAPEGLRIVQDGPAERRRFIDMEISQIRPAYYYALQRYNRALRGRGEILRANGSDAVLDVWDEQLLSAARDIVPAREAFIEGLSKIAAGTHSDVSGGREALEIRYSPAAGIDEFADRLFAGRESDRRTQTTGVGPHRDDMTILINGRDARSFASQGQQRTAAIAIKLSELEVMRRETGEYPVLLLDDVMSELDANRRLMLMQSIKDVQTILTCTDINDLDGAHIDKAIRIKSGEAETADEV